MVIAPPQPPERADTRAAHPRRALLGTRFFMARLRIVADQPMTTLVPLLRIFRGKSSSRIDQDLISFRHDFIQDVYYHDLAAQYGRASTQSRCTWTPHRSRPRIITAHLLQRNLCRRPELDAAFLAQNTAVIAPATATELLVNLVEAIDRGDPSTSTPPRAWRVRELSASHAAQSTALAKRAQPRGPRDLLTNLCNLHHALMQRHRNIAARDSSRSTPSPTSSSLPDRAHLAFAGSPRFMLSDLAAKRLAHEVRHRCRG